jgi:transcriptional regulator with XRE-family HTH domain
VGTMNHSLRFEQITLEYPKVFINQKDFSKRLGYSSSSTVNNWLNGKSTKINAKNRAKICAIFGLSDAIWTDDFNTKRYFRSCIKNYKLITEKKNNNIDSLIFDPLVNMTAQEQKILEEKLDEKILSIETITNKTPSFLFAFAKKLKRDNKITKSLEVIDILQNSSSSYKYTHYNQIEHFKAILLSHNKIKKYDQAIDILKRLYSSAKYHLEEPEIITLIASNYKRKSLGDIYDRDLISKDKVDLDLLVASATLYKEAYNLKKRNEKYYDAINLAYLYNIIDAIEVEYANTQDIEELYSELSKIWKVDNSKWWEVISNAEFLMLLGKTDIAILKVNEFLEFEEITSTFDMTTTLRQLKLYIHFTQDRNAIKFYDYLKTSWEILSPTSL